MTIAVRLVEWTARALSAAWRRQEVEGRYRGADDFRALHIDPDDALASWRAATGPPVPWPAGLGRQFADLTRTWPLALRLGLDAADRLVAVLAVAVELEPRLRPLVSALADDPATRLPSVGLAAELGPGAGLSPGAVRAAADPAGRLAGYDVVRVVAVDGRPSRLDGLLVASEWLVETCGGRRPPLLPDLRWTREGPAGERAARPEAPLAVTGADHLRHAEHVAHRSGHPRAAVLVSAAPDAELVGRAARDARMGEAVLVVACADVPQRWLVATCERLGAFGCPVAVSVEPPLRWVPPPGWPVLDVAPISPAERVGRWRDSLAAAGLTARADDLAALAGEYALGAGGIDDAATRVAASSTAPVARLTGLRAAARRTAWQDLSSVARPGPTGFGWADLVVPERTGRQLVEIAAAVGRRRTVLEDWGFGDRPGARGYHLLFAGPSGTGKTLGAAVVAAAVGLDLWVVDLARVVDKYLGETEKQLDRVLRAGESSGAMLLFDEADALFGRRGEVREARDRWANVEVAYLLQRIEDHDGVTVLTTNVSHHLDDAFARRMSRRVEFPMPDAALRRRLWQRSVPPSAPIRDRADLDTVADRFELAGGAIRTAAVNAAFAAASDGGRIALGHVVRATVGELTKAGRAPTRAELGDLIPLLDEPVGAT